jgi:hypothetical protein
MKMDSMNGTCSFDGFQDSPACASEKAYTCADKKPHVAWEHNDLGAETPCGQCRKPSTRLSFDDIRALELVRFVDRSQSCLSS